LSASKEDILRTGLSVDSPIDIDAEEMDLGDGEGGEDIAL
jgi:hypothetical protein